MYKVVFTQSAAKDLKALDKKLQKRILEKIQHYTSGNSLFGAKKLTNHRIGQFSFRVGDYRILFDLDETTVVILKIEHRKGVYD